MIADGTFSWMCVPAVFLHVLCGLSLSPSLSLALPVFIASEGSISPQCDVAFSC